MAVTAELRLVEQDDDGIDIAFRADVLAGLGQRQKAIPARWFYDRRGSELFEEITGASRNIIPPALKPGCWGRHGDDFRDEIGPGLVVVEFGSRQFGQDPAAASRDRCGRLCPDRHFRRFPASVERRTVGQVSGFADRPGRRRFHAFGRLAVIHPRARRGWGSSRLDDREHGSGHRDRPAAFDARYTGRRFPAADRVRPGKGYRPARQRL